MNATLREVADRLLWEGVTERAIGTSKTFKQLARLGGAPAQRKGPFVPRSVTTQDLEAWIPRLAALGARERAKLKGVSRSRSRQIVAGAVVARAGMKALNVERVDVCPWALREHRGGALTARARPRSRGLCIPGLLPRGTGSRHAYGLADVGAAMP